jgi:hypothetical protein
MEELVEIPESPLRRHKISQTPKRYKRTIFQPNIPTKAPDIDKLYNCSRTVRVLEGINRYKRRNLSQEDGSGGGSTSHHEGTANAVGGVSEHRGSRTVTVSQ